MQKVTYINRNNEKIVFSGAPYVLGNLTGLGLAELTTNGLHGVYQQGETIASYRRNARLVTLTLHLLANSRNDLYQHRMNLLGILSPGKAMDGEKRGMLIYENDQVRYWTYAIPEGGLDAKSRVQNVQPNLKLTFCGESPYWYAMNPSTVAFAYSGEGFSLPFSFPIDFGRRDYSKEVVNAGHVEAPVEIAIACKGEVPRLYNQTTGKRIALVSAIAQGNTLVLNTDPARLSATIRDAEGNETGAFGQLSLETPLAEFVLAPGVNELVYEAGGAQAQSEITVAWYNAYEGV